MKTFKDSSFQDRVGRAAEAKQRALEQFRAKPPIDASVAAERVAASLRRERANAEKAAARKAAKQAQAEASAAQSAARAAALAPRSEAERKAERDARYAARKNRK
jgi:hypothetical protein